MTGKVGMNACKEVVAQTERVKERKKARAERGAGDVPMEPENGEQMADRYAVVSCEDERQHDDNPHWLMRIGDST